MSSIFEKMMTDIFNNQDFLETALIDGEVYDVITSPIVDGVVFAEYGTQSTENFTLDIKLPLSKTPKINSKIKFRDKWYKLEKITVDSSNSSIKVYLIDVSQGIG